MNRIAVAVILLFLSVSIGITGYFLISASTSELVNLMETDRELTLQTFHASEERAREISVLWESKEAVLVSLLPHSELDEIEMAIKNLPEYQKQGLNEEYIKALDDCINRLRHIKESEMTYLKNIF